MNMSPSTPPNELLEPFEYDDFISITSSGGHIGRLFWDNQCQFTVETWESGADPWEGPGSPSTSDTSEVRGGFALISTVGDWYAWLLFNFTYFQESAND